MPDAARLLLLPHPRRLVAGAGEGAPRGAAAEIRPDTALGRDAFALEIGGGAVCIRHGAGGARRYAEETLRQIRRSRAPRARAAHGTRPTGARLMLDVSCDRARADVVPYGAEPAAGRNLRFYPAHLRRGHDAVWRNARRSPEDVRWLDAPAAERT
jgi:hypothetical protein